MGESDGNGQPPVRGGLFGNEFTRIILAATVSGGLTWGGIDGFDLLGADANARHIRTLAQVAESCEAERMRERARNDALLRQLGVDISALERAPDSALEAVQ